MKGFIAEFRKDAREKDVLRRRFSTALSRDHSLAELRMGLISAAIVTLTHMSEDERVEMMGHIESARVIMR